jgi:hypothetical protein
MRKIDEGFENSQTGLNKLLRVIQVVDKGKEKHFEALLVTTMIF